MRDGVSHLCHTEIKNVARPAGLVHARGERSEPRRELEPAVASQRRMALARPAGLEPATPGLEGRCSIH